MTPNPQPPTHRALSDALSPATRATYDQSAEKLIKWLRALEIMLVLYTVPHNLHAFGITWEFSFSMILLTLGVAVIEGAFLFSAEHFKEGLISSKEQYNYAVAALIATTLMLVSNSILSHLLYLAEAQTLSPAINNFMVWYRGFALPITPIVAVVSALALIAHHPKVKQIGRTMTHVATVTAAEQAADRQRQQAVAELHAYKTQADAQKARATLDAERMRIDLETRQIARRVAEQMAVLDFEEATAEQILKAKIDQMNLYLDGETFLRRVSRITAVDVGKILDRQEKALGVQNEPTTDGSRTPAPFNIETAALPEPVPTSYHPSTNGHGHPNPQRPYGD